MRVDVKPATKVVYGHVRRNLIGFFGANRPLRDITPGDADRWRLYLIGQGLVGNTIRKRSSIAKMYFATAVRDGVIHSNPFARLKGTVQPNRAKDFFVTCGAARQVIDACPNAEWRLLFALSRFGGLRCPSEHLALRWGDIDWERCRMHVRSPKTEHHAGQESRIVPLFPELRPFLEDAFHLADEGTEYVVTRYRDAAQNLRTELLRIIARAGLKPWPKLWQNLRASRQTELEEVFPTIFTLPFRAEPRSNPRKTAGARKWPGDAANIPGRVPT